MGFEKGNFAMLEFLGKPTADGDSCILVFGHMINKEILARSCRNILLPYGKLSTLCQRAGALVVLLDIGKISSGFQPKSQQ